MNLYFLPLPKTLENTIRRDIKKYGDLRNITRSLKTYKKISKVIINFDYYCNHYKFE